MEISIQTICQYATVKVRAAKSDELRLKYGDSTLILWRCGNYYIAYNDCANIIGRILDIRVDDNHGTNYIEIAKDAHFWVFPRLVRNGYRIAITED